MRAISRATPLFPQTVIASCVWNSDVLQNLDGVLSVILAHAQDTPT
jgi:hypothetical protein